MLSNLSLGFEILLVELLLLGVSLGVVVESSELGVRNSLLLVEYASGVVVLGAEL